MYQTRDYVAWRNDVNTGPENSFLESLNCKAADMFYTEFNETFGRLTNPMNENFRTKGRLSIIS